MKTQDLEKVKQNSIEIFNMIWVFLTYLVPTSNNRLLKNMNFYALMYGHAYRWIGAAVFFLLVAFGPKGTVNKEAFDFMFTCFAFFCIYLTFFHFSIRKTLPFSKPTIKGNSFRINIK